MNKHPIIWFYLLAFGISWLGWLPTVLGSHNMAPFNHPYFQCLLILPAIAPALAAVIVSQVAYGKAQIRNLFMDLFQWRVRPGWYLVAGLGPLSILLVAQWGTKILGLSAKQPVPQRDFAALALSALVMSLLSNPWEEVGWRGFALPHLQRRSSAWVATLVVGMLWGAWHVPLFFWVGNPMAEYPFLPWFVGIVAESFIYTWIYNSTNGSLLLVTLFHVALNTFGVMFTDVSVSMLAVLYVMIALILLVTFGGTNISTRERMSLP